MNLTGCQSTTLNEADKTKFIQENNLTSSIELADQDRYYFFAESAGKVDIYVLKGKKSAKFISSHTELQKNDTPIYLGGLDPGYVGMYMTSQEIIDRTKTIRVKIHDESFDYNFPKQKAHIIKNEWITDYGFRMTFLDDAGNVIFEYGNPVF